MNIKRDDIDKRKVDFSDIASGRRLPPVHPGEILRDEFLKPMDISVYELANAIKVPRTRVNDIVLGRRAITVDTAICLGRYFGTSLSSGSIFRRATIWMSPTARYDVASKRKSHPERLDRRSCATIGTNGRPIDPRRHPRSSA